MVQHFVDKLDEGLAVDFVKSSCNVDLNHIQGSLGRDSGGGDGLEDVKQ